VDLNPSYLIFLGLFVLCIFCSQAGVTKTIVDASDSKISFFKAIQLNIAGGFWGLVMPFGSASYKAQALKLDYQISIKRYASMFLFSTLLSAWLSAIFLCATVIKLPLWPYRLVFMGVGGVSLLMIPIFYFMKYKQSHLADLPVKGLGSWHVLGLLSYIGLYYFCFKTLGWPIPLIALSAWVAVQSLLFVFPLVPGNLVIMEALGAYLLVQQNLSAESVVIGITLMRLACLLGLLCLSPWVAFGRAREKVKVS
jgi:uncharacterized membrane protein YbhN (UPF0104 family)